MSSLVSCDPMHDEHDWLIRTEHGNTAEADTPQAALVAARELRHDHLAAALAYYSRVPAVTIFYRGKLALSIAQGANAEVDTAH